MLLLPLHESFMRSTESETSIGAMKMTLRQITAVATLSMVVSIGGIARADVIYDFSGVLDSGAPITGVLALSNAYAPGAPLAEASGLGGGVFVSYRQIIGGFADWTETSADYILVAGGPDPITNHTPAGDGPLPDVPGVPKIADVAIVKESVPGGLNDYQFPGGEFIASNDGTTVLHGTEGMWTLRAGSTVSEPATLSLIGLAFATLGIWTLRAGGPGSKGI